MSSDLFARSRLSAREDAILEAAIEGLTDIQIALRLNISQSTVNSYWVRIRGKLGQLSRTELVALALKAVANIERETSSIQLEELREAARSHTQISADYEHAEVFRAALDAMPEAILIVCHKGLIRYANARLAAMFGYTIGDLIDQGFEMLLQASERDREGLRIVEYLKDPHPLRIGLNRVVYGQRQNGTLFRIVLLVDSQPTSTGPIATCVVRDFAAEVDTRRDHASTWA